MKKQKRRKPAQPTCAEEGRGKKKIRLHQFGDQEAMNLAFFDIAATQLGLPRTVYTMESQGGNTAFTLSLPKKRYLGALIQTTRKQDLLAVGVTFTRGGGRKAKAWHFLFSDSGDDPLIAVPKPIVGQAQVFCHLPDHIRRHITDYYLQSDPDSEFPTGNIPRILAIIGERRRRLN